MNKALIEFILTLILVTAFIGAVLFYFIPHIFPTMAISKQELTYILPSIFILLALVISNLRGNSLSYLIKNIIIWQFIILLIVILYAFRFDLKNASVKVAATLFPSYGFDYSNKELVISRSIDGHFYIEAEINGTPIKLMFDTGASGVALTKQDAAKLNLDSSMLQFNIPFSTANGQTMGALVILKQFKFGNFIFNDVAAYIMSGENNVSLLGMSLISQFKNFRIEKDYLILTY